MVGSIYKSFLKTSQCFSENRLAPKYRLEQSGEQVYPIAEG